MYDTSLIDFIEWYVFSDVSGVYLSVLRITVFGLPLYLLLSRYYGHLGRLPSRYLANRYEGKRVSTLTFLPPHRIPFGVLHVVSVAACVTGLVGVLPALSAVVASFSIIVLNNYYSAISTSDLEVLPYVVGMWAFAVLDPNLTAPIWSELGGGFGPDAPVYSFRLVQLYFCSVFFINGIMKVPFWREWILD